MDGAFRIVAPLTPITRDTPSNRLVPIIEHDGQKFAVLFNLITNLSSRLLRHPVGSIAQYGTTCPELWIGYSLGFNVNG